MAAPFFFRTDFMPERIAPLCWVNANLGQDAYDMLEKEGFSSMEELDGFLDDELRKYYAERIAVTKYYDQKLSQMQGD